MRDKIVRHAGVDRLVHWTAAVCVLILLATAFLPILGLDFAWVEIHWWTGFALIAVVLIHILRSLAPARFVRIWIGPRDIAQAFAVLRRTWRRTSASAPKSGKYSFAQKFIHLAFAGVVLAAIVTGGMLMVKTDTPWWERNPYWLSDEAWGIVNVIHGLSALLLITMVITHIYFALRPEKRLFLRSMFSGTITGDEFKRHHDPARWQVEDNG